MKTSELSKEKIEKTLKNWNTLASGLGTMKQPVVQQLLDYEIRNKKRYHIIKRLFTRNAKLRQNEEFKNILKIHKIKVSKK